MKHKILLLLSALLLIACNSKPETPQQDHLEVFTKELKELKTFFSVPGLSAIVSKNNEIIYENYFGYADIAHQVKVDSLTAFPIASITKLYSATLLMKLAENNTLSLDTPVKTVLTNVQLSDSIQVKHLLSHTSQGNIGKEFFYSSRFSLLTPIIEKVTGSSFNNQMESNIFEPLHLEHTFLLKDSSQIAHRNVKIAMPYVLDEGIQNGFIDYGYSTSAGIVSTARNLIQFSDALDNNTLIDQNSKENMYQGVDSELPYAYGLFNQTVEGHDVLWVYGQYDCYSSLLLKVPSKNLSLVLLANNNLMSDPARLIMGDITSSLFAMSFLKNYVLDLSDMPLIESPDSVYATNDKSNFYKQKVLAQALAQSFMARFGQQNMETSTQLLEKTFEKHPDYLSYGNINLLHNMSFLKDVAFYMDLGEFNLFDKQIEAISQKLLKESPNDPYLHSYMGTYYDRLGNQEKAKFHYNTIVDLDNFSPNWYTNEAKNWLESNE